MNKQKTQIDQPKIAIIWFRNDLRLHDNLVLNQALELIEKNKIDKILPIFIYDQELFTGKSRQAKVDRSGQIRRNFIIECVNCLRNNLIKKLKSELLILYGVPDIEIINLIDRITDSVCVKLIIATKEIATEEIDLENRLKTKLYERKISLSLIWDATMVHIDDLGYNLYEGKMSISSLHKATHIKNSPNLNIRKPVSLPSNCSFPTLEIAGLNTNRIPTKVNIIQKSISVILDMKGGEDNALNRLDYYLFESDCFKNYELNKQNIVGKDNTSKLSLWLAYGCISPRYIYYKIRQFEEIFGINDSSRHFTRELLLRDLFRYYSAKFGSRIFYLHGPHSKVRKNNRVAYQNKYGLVWKKDWGLFDKWCRGETGYPFVDANMKELNETGYLSHRGRMSVASFLAKDLQIDWRWGAEYFETQLIDFDVGINWAMWRWVASVGQDPENKFHINVVKQGYDHDNDGEYVKMWLPQLVNLPKDLIHCPFRMGLVDQKRYKCTIGKDYPEPAVRLKNEFKQIQIDKAAKPVEKVRKSDFENYLDFDNF